MLVASILGDYWESFSKNLRAGILWTDFPCSRRIIAGLYGKMCLLLWKTIKLSTKVVGSFVFLPFMNRSSCCSTNAPKIGVVCFLSFKHFNMCVMVFHSCFNFQFPNENWYRTSLHTECLLAICSSSLVKCSVVFPIIIWVICGWVLRVICIFWMPVLYQICVLQIFSPSLWLDLLFS